MYNCQRTPRKYKKKWKYVLQGDRFNFLDLNQKLWYIFYIKDPKGHQIVINKLCYEN